MRRSCSEGEQAGGSLEISNQVRSGQVGPMLKEFEIFVAGLDLNRRHHGWSGSIDGIWSFWNDDWWYFYSNIEAIFKAELGSSGKHFLQSDRWSEVESRWQMMVSVRGHFAEIRRERLW